MVVTSLTVGALVGILLSGGFVYWEVGRFAEPQVPVTRFDERKEMFAYTAGLFVGVPLAVAFVLYRLELASGDLIGGLALLAALVAGTEVAQLLLVRSRFWAGVAGPFYALGYRAAIGGILSLALVATYLAAPFAIGIPTATVCITAIALVALEVAGALLSLRPDPTSGIRGGGPWSGALFGAFGFFLLGLGPIAGEVAALAASLLVLAGAIVGYTRLRPYLDRITAPPPPESPAPPLPPSAYGRTAEPPTAGRDSGRRP
ncbi:MAG: hypothetical protein WBG19_04190 [Thermoplasmata archaeon]